jgi:large subunit ribosomal protein L13
MTLEIDATNQPLGRLASKIAVILRGKNSPKFENYKLSGNKVVVLNAGKIKFTGRNKLADKKYFHYSGFPGGLHEKKVKDVFEKKPNEVLRRAVLGMLPKNKLRKETIRNLQFK